MMETAPDSRFPYSALAPPEITVISCTAVLEGPVNCRPYPSLFGRTMPSTIRMPSLESPPRMTLALLSCTPGFSVTRSVTDLAIGSDSNCSALMT